MTDPENATTFLPYFLANFATPIGAFPITVCPSKRPSPVTTKSASEIAFSILISDRIISIPGSKVAFVKAKKANPSPPAAPVPSIVASAFSLTEVAKVA
ncbi:hypothetical protein SAM_0818 [Streptococcus agalactiae CJB111]|nr:hypothetical protein SAM_0818 [Streptococcus agalactiae CJB111]